MSYADTSVFSLLAAALRSFIRIPIVTAVKAFLHHCWCSSKTRGFLYQLAVCIFCLTSLWKKQLYLYQVTTHIQIQPCVSATSSLMWCCVTFVLPASTVESTLLCWLPGLSMHWMQRIFFFLQRSKMISSLAIEICILNRYRFKEDLRVS